MDIHTYYGKMGIGERALELGDGAIRVLRDRFARIDEVAEYNQLKVLSAMRAWRVSDVHFAATTGYGYHDLGRDALEGVYAHVFGGEDALVRPQLMSGTHALHIALSGNLRPGDELLSPVGKPYDTLDQVIGIRPGAGSLAEYGVTYRQVDLLPGGDLDWDGIRAAVGGRTRMAIIQRSKGYALRPTLSVAQIGELVAFLKSLKPDILCLVDNCYGEFVEETEPTEACVQACVMAAPNPPGGMGCTRSVSSDTDDGAALPGSKARGGVASLPGGKAMSNAASLPGSAGAAPPAFMPADLCVGSLIKNPGGGLAPTGGYIVGRKDCVERSAYRLTAPGLGKEVGASLGLNTAFLQGLFLAPTVVAAAHKGALFAAQVFGELGFRAIPPAGEERHDIIQAIELGTPEALCAFCEGIQAAAPVDSFVTPVPWDMPGYDAPVIMAAGAFVQGSSIELSADGPLKPPYTAYFQGGLTWYHAKYGILTALQRMMDKGLV